jgi:hypothetical protein
VHEKTKPMMNDLAFCRRQRQKEKSLKLSSSIDEVSTSVGGMGEASEEPEMK